MNNKQVIIKFFTKNYSENFKDMIFHNLRELLDKHFRKIVDLKFLSAEQYWKFPDLTECIFELKIPLDETIKDVVSCFDINWHYKVTAAKHLMNATIDQEEAIWSANTSPGVFIDKDIEWVHIYTFDDNIPEYTPAR